MRGATHLFPEEGALEQVIERSVDWLDRWLPASPGADGERQAGRGVGA